MKETWRKGDRRRYGYAYWQAIGLLSVYEFPSKAALAGAVIGDQLRPVSRQRMKAIIDKAVENGHLDSDPFGPMPQMARKAG